MGLCRERSRLCDEAACARSYPEFKKASVKPCQDLIHSYSRSNIREEYEAGADLLMGMDEFDILVAVETVDETPRTDFDWQVSFSDLGRVWCFLRDLELDEVDLSESLVQRLDEILRWSVGHAVSVYGDADLIDVLIKAGFIQESCTYPEDEDWYDKSMAAGYADMPRIPTRVFLRTNNAKAHRLKTLGTRLWGICCQHAVETED
jgi:hypothetical protein